MTANYRCPLCQQSLFKGGFSYVCNNNHHFDIAREGYVNLLPVQNKKSKQPGDNKEMVMARRAFFETEHYHFLRDIVAAKCAAKHPLTVLDLGCGEGFYTNEIAKQCKEADVYGIDIAKTAVRYAAKRYPHVHFSVASTKESPFESQCADVIVSIFAPVFDQELARLLKPDGTLFIISPGPKHLFEFKSIIYDDVKLHTPPATPNGFELVEQTPLELTRPIEFDNAQNLITMTPFAWKFKQEHLDRLQKIESLCVTYSFYVSEYRLAK
ncbi:23S rRNA (guanine(745)-N(1))-methyltransferase [Pseudoalteromonas sp. T1lg65]|uniref:23S rRNA (guanine(745)-N(1))-methyltransferase n=1 Tax=Pseudoalteromonas sp. T1lg65 TaxID=2077101 RepID=UPI003F7A20A8